MTKKMLLIASVLAAAAGAVTYAFTTKREKEIVVEEKPERPINVEE